MNKTQRNIVVILVCLAAAGAFPFTVGNYWIRMFTVIFMYGALAQATNILMGFSGLVPFGNVVFFGMGAYITGIAMITWKMPFPAALLLAALSCATFTLIIGHPILKLQGHYFAIATMGISEAIRQMVTNLDFTGGGMGLNLPLPVLGPGRAYYFFYFLMLLMMLAVTGATYLVTRSRLGYALRAVMANEEGGRSLGINTAYYKVLAWAISAFFTGAVGGVFAYWYSYIDPPSVFDISIAVRFIIMILLGGAGTIIGPILGAFFIELLTESIWSKFLSFHLGVLGTVIMLVVIFMPKGFVWWYEQRFSLRALLSNVRKSGI